jgi:hypothetical protein
MHNLQQQQQVKDAYFSQNAQQQDNVFRTAAEQNQVCVRRPYGVPTVVYSKME